MKKHLSFLLALLCTATITFSQVAYYDALKLKTFLVEKPLPGGGTHMVFDPAHITEVYQLLKNYTLDPATNQPAGTDKAINDLFCPAANTNTFICPYFQAGPAGNATDVATRIFNAAGNADITTFADGLAKFLVKRAKEELFISFFSKLQDDKRYPEFKILFPRTKLLIDNFDSWEYANILNSLREALDKDLKEILADIPKLNTLNPALLSDDAKIRVQAIKDFFATAEGRIFISACQIGNGFISNGKIPDVIHTVSGPDYLGAIPGASTDVTSAIRLFDIVSYSLRSNTAGQHYVPLADFTAQMADPDTRNLYLGLLYQQCKNANIVIGNSDFLANFNKDNAVIVANVRSFANQVLAQTDNITAAFKALSDAKKKGETDLTNYWAAIFESAKGFLQSATNISIINPTFQFPKELQKVIDLSTQSLEVAHDISVRNYSGAIVSVLNFLSTNIGSSAGASGLKGFIVKYGSFAANIVEAKNSDDMEKAIESVALPAGSASIKKHSEWNIALNAYIGGFVGSEFLADKSTKQWATISGMMAPVGVTFSHKLGTASISAFLSLIDVGAFASYRLKDSSTASLPEVQLKNILAPGLGVVLGLPGVPISVGYMHQFGPALREIDANAIKTSDKLNHRWQFFLAVDIPLLNFYSKSTMNIHKQP